MNKYNTKNGEADLVWLARSVCRRKVRIDVRRASSGEQLEMRRAHAGCLVLELLLIH